jgi:ribosome-binding protein aMBF1 (putative translation factor)
MTFCTDCAKYNQKKIYRDNMEVENTAKNNKNRVIFFLLANLFLYQKQAEA